jgi:hypothetical protein
MQTSIGHIYLLQDFMNPQVARHIQRYPQDVATGPIAEMHQVPNGRWFEVDLDLLPPSVLNRNKRFYIHEIAELRNKQWIIPQMWIEDSTKTLCVDGFPVVQDEAVCIYPTFYTSLILTET